MRKFRSFLYPDSTDNDWGSPRNPRTNESLSARNAAYGPNLAWIIHQACRERSLMLAQVALEGGAGGAVIGAGCCG